MTPTTASPLYSGPIAITSTETLKAMAAESGYTNSGVATATFTIASAVPVLSPKPASYTSTQSVTISDSTPGANIYFTIDGTTPSTSSNLYSGPIAVSSTETIKALAAASGYSNSGVATGLYTIAAMAPVFSPKAGTYTASQSVFMTDATAGALIYYTTDGTTPATSSTLYTGPITVATTQGVKAVAVATGYGNSAVTSAAYIIAVPTPVFSPKAGTYTSAQSVVITDSRSGAAIYYTTDGTSPTTASNLYAGPLTVTSTRTLKAMAVASGYSKALWPLGPLPSLLALRSILPAGTYASAQSVTITDTTAGAVIYYTTDGSTPISSSKLYTGPVLVSSNQTIKAIAMAPGYSNSAVGTAAYTISASAPAFTPYAGTYSSAQSVSMIDATPGAAIYYSTDGSIPTSSSKLYTGPVVVSSSQTIKAIAVASGYGNSVVATAAYTISTP